MGPDWVVTVDNPTEDSRASGSREYDRARVLQRALASPLCAESMDQTLIRLVRTDTNRRSD